MNRLLSLIALMIIAGNIHAQIDLTSQIKNNEGAEMCSHTKSSMLNKQLIGMQSFAANNINITYTRAQWYINPSVSYIKGSVTPYFKITGNQVSRINFELDTSMIVDSVIYHGSPVTFADSAAYLLNIYLPLPLSLNTIDSLTIYYQGSPGSSGFGSFIQDTHSGSPVIWTLSEPYGAREWWPCKNDLSDKIDSLDVYVSCPNGNRAASNGLLVNEYSIGNTKIYHWKHRHPIATYLVAIAVTNYAVYSDFAQLQNANVEILNYIYPEDSANAASSTPATITSMQLYSNLFLDYPFADEKYGHAQFGWGGGMEHQTMSFMGGFSHELTAHELAHQWFGDMITCGSWHDIWLNEGFATYLTGLTYEHMPNYPYWENWKSGKIAHIISASNGSVYCDDTTSVNRIFSSRLSYSKGAYVLHMLRWVCGDSAFFQGIKNYLNDVNLKNHYAKTADLKHHLELSSGLNLTEFFNDWYYGQGFPTYNVSAVDYGSGNIEVAINQFTSDPSVSFFEMPVPIYFSGQGMDTIVVLNNTLQGQIFTVNLPFTPDTVLFDIDKHIVCQSAVNLTIGMKQVASDYSIRIFPNPVNEEFTIKMDGEKADFIEIIGTDGRMIFRKENVNNALKLDIGYLATGIYMVRIGVMDQVITKKLFKE